MNKEELARKFSRCPNWGPFDALVKVNDLDTILNKYHSNLPEYNVGQVEYYKNDKDYFIYCNIGQSDSHFERVKIVNDKPVGLYIT